MSAGAPRRARGALAVIAGSGLGGVADAMVTRRVTPFADIPGVGACTVTGHTGEVREGTIGGRECRVVLGRRHGYEGEATAMDKLMAWLSARGVTDVLVTSAAGALRRSLEPGEIVVIRDLIDRQNLRRLEPGAGNGAKARLDPELTTAVERAALRAGVRVSRGSAVCGIGPAYETCAEVEALQVAAGDVATMSGAPEVAAAGRAGIRAAAAALVTNPCTGIASAIPDHAEVVRAAGDAAGKLALLVRQLIVGM